VTAAWCRQVWCHHGALRFRFGHRHDAQQEHICSFSGRRRGRPPAGQLLPQEFDATIMSEEFKRLPVNRVSCRPVGKQGCTHVPLFFLESKTSIQPGPARELALNLRLVLSIGKEHADAGPLLSSTICCNRAGYGAPLCHSHSTG
jgi:hypothetical protein